MAGLKQTIIRGGLESLFFTGAHMALKPLLGGVGVILTLHHVRPLRPGPLPAQPSARNHAALPQPRRQAPAPLTRRRGQPRRTAPAPDEGDFTHRFVCLTFDDGYRDTLKYAYPILKAAEMPFAVYVATSFPDRLGELWWLALEAVIARNNRIGLVIDGTNRPSTAAASRRSARSTRSFTGGCGGGRRSEVRDVVRNLAACYSVDIAAFCKELCMDWQELAQLAADPLVTIGAHTVNHPMLAKLPEKSVRSEMDLSRSVIEAALGARPQHLSYPFGDPTSAGPREFAIAQRARFQDRGDDAAGRRLPQPRRAPDRAAADLAQRRLSAIALRTRAAVGRGDGDVERLPRPEAA